MKSIDFSLELPVEDVSQEELKTNFKEWVTCKLYHDGKMTSKEASEYLNIDDRRIFEDLLGKYGFSILRDTKENIDRILKASF